MAERRRNGDQHKKAKESKPGGCGAGRGPDPGPAFIWRAEKGILYRRDLFLGIKHGYTTEELEKIMGKSLEPTGLILLVTACGGVLRYMLQYSGLGDVIGNAVSSANLPIVVVAFVVAALVRICVGSATVAMTMAAGIIAAMPGIAELSPVYLACTTAAVAGGATVCSHFNDSGFWLVKSLVGLDEKTTLKTWTIMETLVGGTGFVVALIISLFA